MSKIIVFHTIAKVPTESVDPFLRALNETIDRYSSCCTNRHEAHEDVGVEQHAFLVPQTLCQVVSTEVVGYLWWTGSLLDVFLKTRVMFCVTLFLTLSAQAGITTSLFVEKAHRELLLQSCPPVLFVTSCLQFLSLRRGVLMVVLQTFEFWYLTANQVVFALGVALVVYYSGVSLTTSITTMIFLTPTTIMMTFGMDASQQTTRRRLLMMIRGVFTRSLILMLLSLLLVNSANTYLHADIIRALERQVDFYFYVVTPKNLIMSSASVVACFYLKYVFSFIWYKLRIVTISYPVDLMMGWERVLGDPQHRILWEEWCGNVDCISCQSEEGTDTTGEEREGGGS